VNRQQYLTAFLRWCHVAPLPAGGWIVPALAAAGLGLGWWWPHWSTIAHEMGHAVSALLLGGRVSGIKLHANMAGETYSQQRPLPALVSLMAGYAAPPLATWGLAVLYGRGLSGAAVAVLAAVFLVALLLLRSAFGLLTIGSALILLALTLLAPDIRAGMVVVFAAVFAGGGARGIWMAWQLWKSHSPEDTDAAHLRRILRITPQWFWLAAWSALLIFCSYTAVRDFGRL